MSLAECSSSSSMALMGRVSSPGRRSTKVTFAFLLVTFCFFCLAGFAQINVSPAFAKKIYFPGPSFGSEGSGNGQFKEPVGVAVNDSTELGDEPAGDVYVVDSGNRRVEVFSAAGVFQGQFNGSGEYEVTVAGKLEKKTGAAAPGGAFTDPEQVAVDNSTEVGDPSKGDVYVTDPEHKAIDKFTAKGEYVEQLTKTEGCEKDEHPGELPPCPPGTGNPVTIPFAELRNLAVDPSGDLWVFEAARPEPDTLGYVDEFGATGTFMKKFTTHIGTELTEGDNYGFAVDASHDIYVGAEAKKDVQKLPPSASGGPLAAFSEGESAVAVVPSVSSQLANDVLVDKSGDVALYAPVTESNQRPAEVFGGAGLPVGFEGLSASDGLAVNGAATVFASERGAGMVRSFVYVPVPEAKTLPPSAVTETGLVLHGTVDPEGEAVKECFFEYGTEVGVYTTTTVLCEHEKPLEGSEPVAVSAKLSGLPAAGVRSFRVVAVSALGIPGDGEGLTVARPVVSGEVVSGVGAVVATVRAKVDSGSLETCYWVEYGTSAAYGSRVPAGEGCLPVPEGEPASVELAGLAPGAQYHFRFVARNALGTVAGGDQVFSTYGQTASALPDGRVYELVSTPVGFGNNAEVYFPAGMLAKGFFELDNHGSISDAPFAASPDGGAVAFAGEPPPTGGNGEFGINGSNEYVATRAPGGGWSALDVQPATGGKFNEYLAFSPDLSVGVLDSSEALAPLAPAGYNNMFRRATGGASFESLVTTTPGCAPGAFLGIRDGVAARNLLFGGGNAGTPSVAPYTHVVFETDGQLPSEPSSGEGCGAGNDLYDAVGGALYAVNVLPDGKVEPAATVGLQGPNENGYLAPRVSGAVSADGSRIYWSAAEWVSEEEVPKALYVRENDTQPASEIEEGVCTQPGLACTVQVDAAEAACSEAACGKGKERGGRGRFLTASADGSRVLFTDERRLTAGSTAAPGAPDLYQYDLQAPESERLADLSVDEHAGEPGDVEGILGSSEDGSFVYFAAGGVLAANQGVGGETATPQACNVVKEPGGKLDFGACNVYARHEGHTTFIATLPGEEDDFTGEGAGIDGDWQADPGRRTADVTPDGRHLVFMSRRSLTGYENSGMTEVFVYDSETGRVICASCNPTGEPAGVSESDRWGSFLPVSESLSGYQPRVISADGSRVFFDSIESLVPQDINGSPDVYEWEREGAGSCPPGHTAGCIYLLSGGTSREYSFLVDASASGNDVFFVSRADLVKSNVTDYDVLYDARVGGVEPVAAGCSGTGCQGIPPAPPIYATPASVTFNGTGNYPPQPPATPPRSETRAQKLAKALTACKHRYPHRKTRRQACERAAHKTYAPKASAKKSSTAKKSNDQRRST